MDDGFPPLDWTAVRAFLATADAGSYTAAGRALGLSQPTVGRQVAALEAQLGVTLFERVGRGLRLTDAGAALVAPARAMGEGARRLSLAAAGRSASLEGRVRIGASEVVAAFLLPPIVARIRALHPGIEIELVASNQASDLRRREADIAVRGFRPRDDELVGRKLCDDAARLYATPGYLERIGSPSTPAGLSRAEFFAFDHGDPMLAAYTALGLTLTPASFPIVTANHLVHWEMTCQGLGVGVILEDIGDAEPRVVRALDALPPLPVPMWLVSHRELRTSRRIRVVFDLLAEGLTRGRGAPGPSPVGSPPARSGRRRARGSRGSGP